MGIGYYRKGWGEKKARKSRTCPLQADSWSSFGYVDGELALVSKAARRCDGNVRLATYK